MIRLDLIKFLAKINPLPHLNMRLKLIITYTLVIFGVIFVLQWANYRYSSMVITNNSLMYSQLINDKISSDIDTIYNEMDRITQTILVEDQLIKDMFRLGTDPVQDIQVYNEIKTFTNRTLGYRRDIDRLLITNNQGKTFIDGPNNYVPSGYNLKSELWYRQFNSSDQLVLFIPPHRAPFSYYQVFSVVRKIRTYSSDKIVGLIQIDLRVSVFDMICQQGKLDENSLIVFDNEHHPVYQAGVRLSASELGKMAKGLNESRGTFKIGARSRIKVVSYAASAYTGFYTAFVVPEKVLFKDLKIVNTFTNIITIGICIVALILSIGTSFANTRSIQRLLGEMKQLEKGNLDTIVEVKSQDEIAVIAIGLNHMVEQIKILMKKNTEMEIKKNEAEMLALQGQINPHFLYNTLDGIRMKAVINRDEEAAYMIEELSQLLRDATNIKQEMVPLREELDYIERYIRLQNIRFREKFDLTISISESYQQMIVPKFILQPILENAVHHGLEAKKTDRKIWITAVRQKNDIAIMVRDNGIGIGPERLARIQATLETKEKLNKGDVGIGLQNVNRRLQLYYGELYGLKITSTVAGETTVQLLFPSKQSMEESGKDDTRDA